MSHMAPDVPTLLAWLATATVPDGLRVGEHCTVTDGSLFRRHYLDALRTARGQVLTGALANVRAVKRAMEVSRSWR